MKLTRTGMKAILGMTLIVVVGLLADLWVYKHSEHPSKSQLASNIGFLIAMVYLPGVAHTFRFHRAPKRPV